MASYKHLLILVLFLVGFLLASCSELNDTGASLALSPLSDPSPGFNYFKLALQWPYSYCRRYKLNYCKPTVPPDQFTIQGLWPLLGGGTTPPSCCTTTQQLTEATLKKLQTKLTTYWPRLESKDKWDESKILYYEHWRSYGSCSSNSFNPEQYFTKATDLAAKYSADILSTLKKEGINPDGKSYGSQKILAAIKTATKFTADIKCSRDSSSNIQLLEIHLCVKKDGKSLQNCGSAGKDIDCDGKDPIFPSAPTTLPQTPPLPSAPPKPGFDYFVLSLQWPNALCKEQYITCRPSIPRQYFTIHGLWPQKKNQDSPLNCDTNEQMTDALLEESHCDLLKYWPRLYTADDFQKSKKFWIEEWDKHGTCSSNKFLPRAYLQTTLDLGEKYAPLILQKLKDKGIVPDATKQHTAKDIQGAITDATKTKGRIQCTKDKSKKLQLSEVRLCVKEDGKTLQDCTGNLDGDCTAKFIFPNPPAATHTQVPSFVSSILEVEEAVGL